MDDKETETANMCYARKSAGNTKKEKVLEEAALHSREAILCWLPMVLRASFK